MSVPAKRRGLTSGSLLPMLLILALVAAIFAGVLLATGQRTYLPATAVLFGLIIVFAVFESVLARHQASSVAGHGDGPLPVMAVDVTDPFNMDGDLPHEVGIHDFPPGHPSRWTLRQAAGATRTGK